MNGAGRREPVAADERDDLQRGDQEGDGVNEAQEAQQAEAGQVPGIRRGRSDCAAWDGAGWLGLWFRGAHMVRGFAIHQNS